MWATGLISQPSRELLRLRASVLAPPALHTRSSTRSSGGYLISTQLFGLHGGTWRLPEKSFTGHSWAPPSASVSSALVTNQRTTLGCKVETGGNDILSAPPDREVAAPPTWVARGPLGHRSALSGVKAPTSSERWVPEVHSARAPGDAPGSGLRARRAHAGDLTPQAAPGCERGGAWSAAGPRCPQAPPRGWRRGGRGGWRVLRWRVAPPEDPGTRGAGLRPRSGGPARGGGRGGAGPAGAGPGAGRARAPGGRGRGAGRALAAGVSHTRRFGRRRRRQRQRQRQAPPGPARARGSGGRRLPPSVARSLPLPLARRLRGRAPPGALGQEEGGAEDADKFPQQPQIPAQAEAAAPTGQGRARRGAHGQSVPGGGRGAPGPFALRGAAGRDPMRRAREGRAIRSPGGARQRRRAVLQLLEAGIGRQEAAERT
ncbi:hypothetical protein VULLAG_LOCUS3780 [Vulpes lagopus]